MADRRLAPREVVARREGEVWFLESALKLEAPPARLGDLLRRAGSRAPDRDFLIERCNEGLRRVTYREARRAAEGAPPRGPSVGACRALVGRDDPIEELVNHDAVRARVREALMAWIDVRA